MKFLKFTQYVYLVASLFMAYKAFELWNTETDERYLYLFLSIIALGMFFFRRRFFKKYEERARNSKQQ